MNILIEELDFIVNGNPYHAEDGKFTFSPSKASYNSDGTNGPELQKKLMRYLFDKHPELFNKKQTLADRRFGRDYTSAKKDGYKGSEEDFYKDIVTGSIWKYNLEEYKDGNRIIDQIQESLQMYTYGKDNVNVTLQGIVSYVRGAGTYGKKSGERKLFDERYGISKFIDNNKDVHYTSDEPLYRGVTTKISTIKKMKPGTEIDMNGASSWTSSESIADRFLDTSLVQRGKEKVIFKDNTKGERNAMIYPFSSTDSKDSLKSYSPNQNEVLYSGTPKFVVQKVEEKVRKNGERVYYVDVESK